MPPRTPGSISIFIFGRVGSFEEYVDDNVDVEGVEDVVGIVITFGFIIVDVVEAL
nr:1324_t:CDS:2 [Entrophospora candida]